MVRRIPADEVDENFDEDAWNKKVYGPDVIVVDMHSVPKDGFLSIVIPLLGTLADDRSVSSDDHQDQETLESFRSR